MSDSESDDEYIHQLNTYYCVYYHIDDNQHVVKALSTHPKFKALVSAGSNARVKNTKFTIYPSRNSDRDNASYKYFFVNEMTIEGEDADDPEQTFVNIEPTEMVKLEARYAEGVNFITDLYDFLVKDFKEKRLDVKLSSGWTTFSCTWEPDDDDES